MKAKIVSFRRSRHTVSPNHMIIEVDGITSLEKAKDFVGKKVTYNTGKSEINGEIRSTHGNSGALRAIFEKGMPGQSLGSEVTLK